MAHTCNNGLIRHALFLYNTVKTQHTLPVSQYMPAVRGCKEFNYRHKCAKNPFKRAIRYVPPQIIPKLLHIPTLWAVWACLGASEDSTSIQSGCD